ncbi:MAG: peroxiredoxin-like family protein [Cyanobacteria bacterium P01_A01_bin.105]
MATALGTLAPELSSAKWRALQGVKAPLTHLEPTMQTQTTTTLAEQIQDYRNGFRQNVDQATQDTMAAATNALKATGLDRTARQAGSQAPDFSLPNAVGQRVNLSQLLTQGPVIINFYRGEWCPYCNLELRAFQALLPEFKKAGAQLIAISPELPDHSLSVTEKHALEFAVLSDVGNTVAKQYGLVFTLDPSLQPIYQQFGLDIPAHNGDERYELPMPATYVIDRDGTIRYAFIEADYTQRAEPADVLKAVEQL